VYRPKKSLQVKITPQLLNLTQSKLYEYLENKFKTCIKKHKSEGILHKKNIVGVGWRVSKTPLDLSWEDYYTLGLKKFNLDIIRWGN
jgi:hypothetical protein